MAAAGGRWPLSLEQPMVRISSPQAPRASAPEVRSPKMAEQVKRTKDVPKRPVTAGGDTVTITSSRAPARSPSPASATPLGTSTNKPDVK